MTARSQPVHLPRCPIALVAYTRLYTFNGRTDDCLDADVEWQEIRLTPGIDESGVYRLLPAADDFEYGGYLTGTRIRFRRCDATRANLPMSKACTFHSHSTKLATADVPSATDVFQFLAFRHLRTVTVGSSRIWVWDKTAATVATIRQLAAWSDAHMLREVRRLDEQFPNAWRASVASHRNSVHPAPLLSHRPGRIEGHPGTGCPGWPG